MRYGCDEVADNLEEAAEDGVVGGVGADEVASVVRECKALATDDGKLLVAAVWDDYFAKFQRYAEHKKKTGELEQGYHGVDQLDFGAYLKASPSLSLIHI